MPPSSPRASTLEPVDLAKLAFLFAAALWTGYQMRSGGSFGLLQGIITYTHEGGHLLCSFFPRFIHVAAGTLCQLLMPVIFVVSFYLRGERYSSAITCFWMAASFTGASVYCQDAIDQEHPLLFTGMTASEELEEYGETTHDWINMLEMLHLPAGAAHPIAGMLYLAAIASWGLGLWAGLEGCEIHLPLTTDAALVRLRGLVRTRTTRRGRAKARRS